MFENFVQDSSGTFLDEVGSEFNLGDGDTIRLACQVMVSERAVVRLRVVGGLTVSDLQTVQGASRAQRVMKRIEDAYCEIDDELTLAGWEPFARDRMAVAERARNGAKWWPTERTAYKTEPGLVALAVRTATTFMGPLPVVGAPSPTHPKKAGILARLRIGGR